MKDGPEIVAGLRRLSTAALEKICAQDRLDSRDGLRSLANALLVSEDRTGLYRIANTGDTETHTGFVMGAALAVLIERQARDHTQLVLSGPEAESPSVRDTAGVTTQLISSATQECLLLSYAVSHADIPLDLLTRAAHSGVRVICVLDLAPLATADSGSRASLAALQAAGAEVLRWSAAGGTPSSMHAKAIVADRRRCLITSANLTGRALTDNVEIGVLLDNAVVAEGIATHYERLRQSGWLVRFDF